MGNVIKNKSLITIIVLCLLGAVCLLGGAWLLTPKAGALYAEGYVNDFDQTLTDELETYEAAQPIYFQEATKVNSSYSGIISFRNSDGEKTRVASDSLVHYADGSISSIKGMLLTDLDDFQNGLYDIYYLADMMVLTRDSDTYVIDNNSSELTFKEFILKTSDDRYEAVSPSMTLSFPDGSRQELTNGYAEIQFIEEDIAGISDGESSWRFLTDGATLTLQNGCVLDLSTMELLSHKAGADGTDGQTDNTPSILLRKITAEEETNINVDSQTAIDWKMPVFISNAIDGEDGMDGVDGENGVDGEAGAEGQAGDAGNQGSNGTDGSSGRAGGNGLDGTKGSGGQDGDDSNDNNTEAIKTPRISIDEWTQTAGSINVSLNVYNGNYILEGTSQIRIYNPKTGKDEYVWNASTDPGKDLAMLDRLNIAYDALSPSTDYRLIVEASVKRSDEDGTNYGNRVLLIKNFRTDAAGFHLNLTGRTEESLSFSATLAGTRTVDALTQLTLTAPDGRQLLYTNDQYEGKMILDKLKQSINNTQSCEISGLESNTTYKVELSVKFADVSGLIKYQYEYQTLKKAPVAVKTVNGEYTGYTLKAVPSRYYVADTGNVDDPDQAIEYYTYELYRYLGTGNSGSIVDTSLAFSGAAVKVKETAESNTAFYLDEYIQSGVYDSYSLKISYTYYDNEKYVTIYMPYPDTPDDFIKYAKANIPTTSDPYVQYVKTGDGGVTQNRVKGYLEVYTGAGIQISVGDSDLHYIQVNVSSAAGNSQKIYYTLAEWQDEYGNSLQDRETVRSQHIRLPIDWTVVPGTTYTITVGGFTGVSGSSDISYQRIGTFTLTTPKEN